MKHVIITGSNGMIGKLVLENCLQNSSVATVTSITREPIGIMHSKLTEVIHTDFLDYTSVEEHFKNKDVCFYCIGVYTGQVPVDEFKKITVDFTKAFSEVLKQNSPHASFCFLSGAGADSTEKSSTLFAKQKGIAENGLIRLQFRHTFIFRPDTFILIRRGKNQISVTRFSGYCISLSPQSIPILALHPNNLQIKW